jgi:uncharacterized membrane protein
MTNLLKNMIIPPIESYWPALLLILIGGILLYLYRYNLADTYRERKAYTKMALNMIIIPTVFLTSYLFFTESYWILSFLIAGFIYYSLDHLGLLPILISLRKEHY